jgi:hypothetical protein
MPASITNQGSAYTLLMSRSNGSWLSVFRIFYKLTGTKPTSIGAILRLEFPVMSVQANAPYTLKGYSGRFNDKEFLSGKGVTEIKAMLIGWTWPAMQWRVLVMEIPWG